MKANLIQQIVSTRLRPKMLLWLDLENNVYFIELTVPWKDRVEFSLRKRSMLKWLER